jgi:O-antigen/teichoic acid export membrane protein
VAAVGIPFCVLQAALAGPIVHVFFTPRSQPQKWDAAIPVLGVLSFGMAFHLVGVLIANLLQAQGRFRFFLKVSAIYAAVFLAGVSIAAAVSSPESGALAVAAAVTIVFILFDPLFMYLAIGKGRGGSWYEVAKVFLLPLLNSLAAIGTAKWITDDVLRWGNTDLVSIAGVSLLSAVIYLPLARWTMPQAYSDVVGRMLSRFGRGASGSSPMP